MLRVVGLGPGDPELLTIKAIRLLSKADVIYVPRSSRSEASLAKNIVLKYARGRVVELPFDMGGVREEQLREIAKIISSGENAVYAVLGDPSLYSTFGKIRKYVDRPVEYVPGVSALISCSLRAGVELAVGDMAVAIVPASRADLLKEALRLFDVVVVAKANRNIELLNELLSSHGGYAVRRCYMEGEAVSNRITWSDYFTTVYLWRAR